MVVGSGIAGLAYAVKVAKACPAKKVLVLAKGGPGESNTRYAQGGIAAVLNNLEDSYEQHIQDTLIAGDGLCDPKVVDFVVKEAPEHIEWLFSLGTAFDRDQKGNPALGKEGGHSHHRIVHAKDQTGFAVQDALLKAVRPLRNVEFPEGYFAMELLMDAEGRCAGVSALSPTGKPENIASKVTVLATGGLGQVYETTTNPAIATGDGIAMAARAGAEVADMEFVQFHPTALYGPDKDPAFLVSEAVRGFGAELRNGSGEAFMKRYDARGSLATRDIVSRAIHFEMLQTGEKHVFLDLGHLDIEAFARQFPVIYAKSASLGLDLKKDMMPVAPAAHYFCGGVKTDHHGRTGIPNLFCIGESARTGLHGANRLASNSLLEALVFAHRAFEYTIGHTFDAGLGRTGFPKTGTATMDVSLARKTLRQLMRGHVGIVRQDKGLLQAQQTVEGLQTIVESTPLDLPSLELRNMLQVARMIIQASLARQENKGCFYKN